MVHFLKVLLVTKEKRTQTKYFKALQIGLRHQDTVTGLYLRIPESDHCALSRHLSCSVNGSKPHLYLPPHAVQSGSLKFSPRALLNSLLLLTPHLDINRNKKYPTLCSYPHTHILLHQEHLHPYSQLLKKCQLRLFLSKNIEKMHLTYQKKLLISLISIHIH